MARLTIKCGDCQLGMSIEDSEIPKKSEDFIPILEEIIEMLKSKTVPDPDIF